MQAGLQFGGKYFNFLDDQTRSLCDEWFRVVAGEEGGGGTSSEVSKGGRKGERQGGRNSIAT